MDELIQDVKWDYSWKKEIEVVLIKRMIIR